MPNIDLLTIVKWVVIIFVALTIVALIVAQFAEVNELAKVAVQNTFEQPAQQGLGWVDTGGNEANRPSMKNVGNIILDSLLGEGVFTVILKWLGGSAIMVILAMIGWGIWKAVVS